MLFTISFSLNANTNRETKIYIPLIIGYGTEEENAFFLRQLTHEVFFHYPSIVRSKWGSDFTLKGTIEPYTNIFDDDPIIERIMEPAAETITPVPQIPEAPATPVAQTIDINEFSPVEAHSNIYFFNDTYFYNIRDDDNFTPVIISAPIPAAVTTVTPDNIPVDETTIQNEQAIQYIPDGSEYVFYLQLIDNATNTVIGEQYLIYTWIGEGLNRLINIMVYNILSVIPDIIRTDDLRQNWLFVDISALWAPRIYYGQSQSVNWLNFGFRIIAECHFTDILAVGFGVQISQDWIAVSPGNEYRDLIMEFPIMLKFVFKPSLTYMLEPYAGFSFNYSLMQTTQVSPVSLFAGLQFGVGIGSGLLVIDPRLSMDLIPSSVASRTHEYQRYMMQIGIGYKIGFFPKRTNRDY